MEAYEIFQKLPDSDKIKFFEVLQTIRPAVSGNSSQAETAIFGNNASNYDRELCTLANNLSQASKLLDVKSSSPTQLSQNQRTLDRWIIRTGTRSSEKNIPIPEPTINEQAVNNRTNVERESLNNETLDQANSATGVSFAVDPNEVNFSESSKDIIFTVNENVDRFSEENVSGETNCNLSINKQDDGETTETDSVNFSDAVVEDIVNMEESLAQNYSDILVVEDLSNIIEHYAQDDPNIVLFAGSVGEVEVVSGSTFDDLSNSNDLPILNMFNQPHTNNSIHNSDYSSEGNSRYNLRAKRRIVREVQDVQGNKSEFNSTKNLKGNYINKNVSFLADDISSNAFQKSPHKRKQGKVSKHVSNPNGLENSFVTDGTESDLLKIIQEPIGGEKGLNLSVPYDSIETAQFVTENNLVNLEVGYNETSDILQCSYEENKSVSINAESSGISKGHYKLRKRTHSREDGEHFSNAVNEETCTEIIVQKSLDSIKDSINSVADNSYFPPMIFATSTVDVLTGETALDSTKNNISEFIRETNTVNIENNNNHALPAKLQHKSKENENETINAINQATGTSKCHYQLRKRTRSQEDCENFSVMENDKHIEMNIQKQHDNEGKSTQFSSDSSENYEVCTFDNVVITENARDVSEIKVSEPRKETNRSKNKEAKNETLAMLENKNKENKTENQNIITQDSTASKRKPRKRRSKESFDCSPKTADIEHHKVTFKQINEVKDPNVSIPYNSELLTSDTTCTANLNGGENIQNYPVMEISVENLDADGNKMCSLLQHNSIENMMENHSIEIPAASKCPYKLRRKTQSKEDSEHVCVRNGTSDHDEQSVQKQVDNEKESNLCIINKSPISYKTCSVNLTPIHENTDSVIDTVELVKEINVPKHRKDSNIPSVILEENSRENETKDPASGSPKCRYKLRTRQKQHNRTPVKGNMTDCTSPEVSNYMQENRNVTSYNSVSYSENPIEELSETQLLLRTNHEAEQKFENLSCDVESELNRVDSSSCLENNAVVLSESEQLFSIQEETQNISTKNSNSIERSEDLISDDLTSQLESPVKELTANEMSNFKYFSQLKETCASFHINIEDIFEQKEITEWLDKKHENSDAVIFIGKHKLQSTGNIVPVIYTHRSKQELWDILCKITDNTDS